MRTRNTSGILVLMSCLLLPDVALAATQTVSVQPSGCAPEQQRINDNNNLLLLGGTAQGPIKQIIVGEFGKDVDQQKRLMGKFDRCGVLTRADINYDKAEGNRQLKLDLTIEQVKGGWLANYDVTVVEQQEGKDVVVHHKQGLTQYSSGRLGNITSVSEHFSIQGQPGFTETTTYFDRRGRLIRSVARGSDSNSSGEDHYRWNDKNQLVSSVSDRHQVTWNYDKQGREMGLMLREYSPLSASTTLDECQLWDEYGNCTLTYSREMEVSAVGLFRRNITAASRYEYWDQP